MRLAYKLILTAIFGLTALIGLFLFKSYSYNVFSERNRLELNFAAIESAHRELNYQLLNNALFLYANQDVISHAIDDTYSAIDTIAKSEHVKMHHKESLKLLNHHRSLLDIKVQSIYDFQTANIVIKNTTAALLHSGGELFKDAKDSKDIDFKTLQETRDIIGSIVLAKSALDDELIDTLKHSIDSISSQKLQNIDAQETVDQILTHLKTIESYFPKYVDSIENIREPQIIESLMIAKEAFTKESNAELENVVYFSYLLVVLFIISIGVITYFHLHSEREARFDRLTKLRNRKSYEEDLAKRAKEPNLSLMLINIDKFRHYNDFYGIKEGDRFLIEMSKHIQKLPFLGKNPYFYRISNSEFGVLFSIDSNHTIEQISKAFLNSFLANPITIDGESRQLPITISASNHTPLLETADMVLKHKYGKNPIIYDESLGLYDEIASNIEHTKELREAIEGDNIVAFFQPILNTKTKEITKHEALARIKTNGGDFISIQPYLHIAKESFLYSHITIEMLDQTFKTAALYSGEFSINLSIEDISNKDMVAYINNLLHRYAHISKYIIFEILESQTIDQYDSIAEFISTVKHHGCKIAIDDFGSGYSNFARVLNLSIDILKIDGSLVKNLDRDHKALCIIETIASFARNNNIDTVAEFVHNEKVAQKIEELEINESQGFYYYEPAELPIAEARVL